MQEISCILCHKNNDNIFIKENGFTGKKCDLCSVVYISPRPVEDEIFQMYSHDEAHISAQSHIKPSLYKRWHAQHTLNIIKKYIKKGRLLEIGAGGGHFLSEAKKMGFDPFAIELNKTQAQFITSHFGFVCEEKPLSKESFGDLAFDVIYHSDVLSHLHDPVKAYEIMWKKLKPGGLLIFETGNVGDIHSKYKNVYSSFQYPDHLFFFGQNSIATLLSRTGFNLCKIYAYNIMPQLSLMSLMSRHKKPKESSQKNNGQKQNSFSFIKNIYHALLFFLRYIFGRMISTKNKPMTLIVVAQK